MELMRIEWRLRPQSHNAVHFLTRRFSRAMIPATRRESSMCISRLAVSLFAASLGACLATARLRRPLRRRFQHLRAEHLGGGRGRRHLAGRDRLGARRRAAGSGGAEFRPPPARHLQQDASSNMSRPASAPGASMAAARCCSVTPRCCRGIEAQVRRAAADPGRDLGAGDRFRQGRHGQIAGVSRARDPGA